VQRMLRLVVVGASVAALVALGLPAGAGHDTDPHTSNVHPKGHISYPASLTDTSASSINVNTDTAFWGKHAILGTWLGFRIIDISDPDNPVEVGSADCPGNQGDVLVWDNIVVRSWNTPVGNTTPLGFSGTTCDGETIPNDPNPIPITGNFEGVHVFDISDPTNPDLVATVETECGSHTATAVPDVANDRLLVYNGSSSGLCPGLDIIEVPLDAPEDAELLNDFTDVPAGRPCHDNGVILGDALLTGCAGGNGFSVFSMDPDDGGSLEDPILLYSQPVPNVTIGHSAGFTWDGEVLIFGHEPGGGVQAECEATDAAEKKSYFFYEAETGVFIDKWTLPRPQSNIENCTLHNFNTVPLRSGRDVIVHGSYQSGMSVVDMTDPENAVELGYSDPLPIPPTGSSFCDPDYELGMAGTLPPNGCEIGGDWSAYWYNNFIYESSITEGFNIFRFSGPETRGAMRLGHLNPNTQEFTIPGAPW
jgi:hypothetical protein